MKKLAVLFLSLFMIAAVANAQHGGGHGPGAPEAEHGGHGGFGGGPEGHGIVGSDGTLYLASATEDATANTASTKITAVRPSGAVAWTATLAVRVHVTLSGPNLIAQSATRGSDGTITTTLTAISTASGATAWTKTFNGRVELEPFNGGTYAFVTVPAATSGGTATRSLVGIGNDGSTLFTLAL